MPACGHRSDRRSDSLYVGNHYKNARNILDTNVLYLRSAAQNYNTFISTIQAGFLGALGNFGFVLIVESGKDLRFSLRVSTVGLLRGLGPALSERKREERCRARSVMGPSCIGHVVAASRSRQSLPSMSPL